jgi:hypothetical protein
MWWILQVTGCLAITATLTYMRVAGLHAAPYAVYVLVQAAFIGWAFPISYMKAPSFFQAWFLGNATLALGGFAVSFYLKDVVLTHNYVGAALAIIGSILLII